ncbi:MAG: S4 domain-containing protein, partial [Bacteroidota bacterium]
MKIKSDSESTLIDFLFKEFKTSSRSSVKRNILYGNISLNGNIVTNPVTVVHPGDQVEYSKYKAPENTSHAPFPVLFEDESVIVVEKRAGLLTYGEKGT